MAEPFGYGMEKVKFWKKAKVAQVLASLKNNRQRTGWSRGLGLLRPRPRALLGARMWVGTSPLLGYAADPTAGVLVSVAICL